MPAQQTMQLEPPVFTRRKQTIAPARPVRHAKSPTLVENNMRVLVVAPAGLYSDALCALIAKLDPECATVRMTDTSHALDRVAAQGMRLIVLDLDGSEDESVPLVARYVTRFPSVPLVVAATSFDADLVERVLDAGASGFLPKHYTEPLTLGVLHLVLDGASYRPHVKRQDVSAKGRDALDDYGITERQGEVLALMAQGLPNASIAKRLGISEGTTRLHVSAVLRALNVQNRSEAIVMALRIGNINMQQVQRTEGAKLDLGWLLPHMKDERHPQGSVVFSKGEPGTALFYLQRGSILLQEFTLKMGPGSLFGEIGIFAPGHIRTATAICESDVNLLTLTAAKVKEIYALNPQFAFYVVHLIAERLMADQARLV
jgi:two-component system, NarL family, nitrate/nitrite response regulator NarL